MKLKHTRVLVETQTMPMVVTSTTIENMDSAMFTTIIRNASPRVGGLGSSTNNVYEEDVVMINLVTTFKVVDVVVDVLLQDAFDIHFSKNPH